MRQLNVPIVMAAATLCVSACTEPRGSAGAAGCGPQIAVAKATSLPLPLLGHGTVSTRYTAEVDARGTAAYTTTWGLRNNAVGNALFVWNVAADAPTLVDSVIVTGATTLGDVAISDDGSLLVVATEFNNGGIVIYDLADPYAPVELSRFADDETSPGVHTAEIGRVDGHLYAFLSVDPSQAGSRLVIVDLADPRAPRQVYSKIVGKPFVHDVYLRDGVLFLALWDDGLQIWDLGGAGSGSPESPRVISSVHTIDGSAHNIWWFHDPATRSRAYAFVGEEGPTPGGGVGVGSSGDIHVVDVCDLAAPKEVAFFHIDGAGAHNFSMDESRGILYAAFYNGGVRAIDVRGNLASCGADERAADGRCDLAKMGREVATGVVDEPNRYIWGVVYRGGLLYLSDMINGLWKLKAVGTP